jgi:addiction module HigA family antidote
MYPPAKMHNVHPGEVLLEEFVKPLELTAYRIAKDIDVPANRIEGIIKGTRNISPDTAARLARYFGVSEQFWLNLQSRYDAIKTKEEIKDVIIKITPLAETVHGKKRYAGAGRGELR